MPMMEFAQFDPTVLRTYWEKRDLKQNDKYVLKAFDDAEFMPKVRALTQEMLQEFWPFDYGRFEFRLNRETGKRSEEHTSELQSLMRISYAVFCLKKKII